MSHLNDLADPRKPSNGTLHDFREILVIAIAAVLSDCDSVEDIAFWARAKETWLRRFLWLKNGVPSEDTFLRLFRAIDPKQFEAVFRRWVGGICPTPTTFQPTVPALAPTTLTFLRVILRPP